MNEPFLRSPSSALNLGLPLGAVPRRVLPPEITTKSGKNKILFDYNIITAPEFP
jgi:hypothetical protein